MRQLRRVVRGLVTATLVLGGVACESPTKPPSTVANVTVGPGASSIASGAALQLTATLTDSKGRNLGDRPTAWSALDTTVLTVSASGLVTAKYNTGAINKPTVVTAVSEGVSGTAAIAVQPSIPTSLTIVPPAGTLSGADAPILAVQLRDSQNNLLTGRLVEWVSRDTSKLRVTSDGQLLRRTFIDSENRDVWVVGSSGALQDSVLVSVAPSLLAGLDVLPQQPFVKAGYSKRLGAAAVLLDGGRMDVVASFTSTNPAIASVSEGGLVSTTNGVFGTTQIIATYGSVADTVTLTVDACGAAPAGGFPLSVRFYTGAPSAAVQAAFECAERRIKAVIRNPLPATLISANIACADNQPLNEVTAGIIIFAAIVPIDGPGGVLGSAGPCWVRSTSRLTAVGVMRFDDADLANMAANGTLGAVIMHEMLHVIGIGTTWREPTLNLWTGAVVDPGFLGARARNACIDRHGGATTCAAHVPIEDCVGIPGCGAGTIHGHWREGIFQHELMTGYLTGARQPFSAMTIEALGDLGFGVDLHQADEYSLLGGSLMSPSLMMAPGDQGLRLPAPVLPTHEVTPDGRIRRILH
ncbi:MAG: hypothetical protein KF689_08000 [Gemmatimonadaceae bacterium]|nr:hypothetical protein [Gemmatimonadaceae bacterium]MCW5827458.1 hypothetical protein [Gemmatimonadaceae bacterium]